MYKRCTYLEVSLDVCHVQKYRACRILAVSSYIPQVKRKYQSMVNGFYIYKVKKNLACHVVVLPLLEILLRSKNHLEIERYHETKNALFLRSYVHLIFPPWCIRQLFLLSSRGLLKLRFLSKYKLQPSSLLWSSEFWCVKGTLRWYQKSPVHLHTSVHWTSYECASKVGEWKMPLHKS